MLPAASFQSVAEEEFERILYHITHDLRAAFRAVKTIPDWIREDLDSPGGRENIELHLEMLEVQAGRGDQILLDLRKFSRVGRRSEAPVHCNLQDCIDRTSRTVGLPAGFNLVVEGDDADVLAPPGDLTELFAAILGNAVKHHDAHTGKLNVRIVRDGNRTTVLCADDGPGVPSRFNEKVFELMSTLKPRDVCEGSGVGLALCRRIMRHVGGFISILPCDSRGTTVRLDFPAIPEDVDGDAAATVN